MKIYWRALIEVGLPSTLNVFLVNGPTIETIEKRCRIYSSRLALDPKRILEYAFAYDCLSAAWYVEDGQSPEETLRVAKSIQALLKTTIGVDS